jgi:hypothetical protein
MNIEMKNTPKRIKYYRGPTLSFLKFLIAWIKPSFIQSLKNKLMKVFIDAEW